MATVFTGCCTSVAAPFFTLSLRRHRAATSSVSKILSNYNRNRILMTAPLSLATIISNSNCTSAARRRLLTFSCNCTDAQSNQTTTTTTIEENSDDDSEDLKIKEAANSLDIRVGRILKAWRHEEADSLYVEEVDVGEPEPRTICSGLVNYIPIDLMQDMNVIVLANLKARNMRGVKSNGMLMAASDASHEKVELLSPPEGAVPGERVWFGSVDENENLPDAASPNQVQKKKIWELVQPHLKTDESCAASLGLHPMRTLSGVITCDSLKNANIS